VIENELTPQNKVILGAETAELETQLPPASFWERTLLFWITAVIITIDHLTKVVVESWLPLNSSITPFPDWLPFFRITHVSNTGAAFGLFPQAGPLFMVVAMIVAVVILFYNFQLPAGHRLLRIALGLQMGGALGNMIDRFRLGHVTDFFDVGRWPVFNIADASIVSGVIVLGYLMLLEHQRERQEQRELEAARLAETAESAEPEVEPDLEEAAEAEEAAAQRPGNQYQYQPDDERPSSDD
jgi:signal peptidase II